MKKIFLIFSICVCFLLSVPVLCFADDSSGVQTADQTANQTAEEVPESKYDQIYSLIVKYVFGNQPLTDSQAIAVDLLSLIGCVFVFAVPFIVVFFIIRRISS